MNFISYFAVYNFFSQKFIEVPDCQKYLRRRIGLYSKCFPLMLIAQLIYIDATVQTKFTLIR